MRANRQVALVTGAGRGIGRACALALAGAGFDLVVNDLALSQDIDETSSAIRDKGTRAEVVTGDVADLDQHEDLLAAAWRAFGRLDCLVCNAGVAAPVRGDLLDITPKNFDHCQAVNSRGLFFLIQRCAQQMVADDVGDRYRSIIVITSVNATVPSIDRGDYCISKAAASMTTQLFAERLAPEGIAVFEVRPGIIRTLMTAPAKDRYDHLLASRLTPIARWGEPDEVGRTVATAATGALPFTVGQVLNVDAGLRRRMF